MKNKQSCRIDFLKLFLIILYVLYLSVRLLLPTPPKIKHGEFPFVLEYQINGEKTVVKDTFICDYAGYGFDEMNLVYRKWKSHLDIHKPWITIFKNENIEIFFTPASIGDSFSQEAQYMGDDEIYDKPPNGKVTHPYPSVYYKEFSNGRDNIGMIDKETLLNKYGIILTDYKVSLPITNSFYKHLEYKDIALGAIFLIAFLLFQKYSRHRMT